MDEQNNNNNSEERYPLDDALTSLLDDFAKGFAQIEKQASELNAQQQGALVLFLRQHELQGNWRLAENRRELVKATEQAVQQQGG